MSRRDFGIDSITDAFLALKDVYEDIDVKPSAKRKGLKEAASVDVRNMEDVELAQQFKASDKKQEDSELEVIDVDADSIENLQDGKSYIGKMLLQCNSCKATRFVDVDKLAVDENDKDLYNVDDECPHCHNKGTGYALIGQVGKTQEDNPEDNAALDNDVNNGEEAMFDNTNEVEPQAEETPAEEKPAEETSNNEDTKENTGETSYNETSASDDTDELNLPELGDEFDVDDVMEDDTEEKSDNEDKKKVKKESLNESDDEPDNDDEYEDDDNEAAYAEDNIHLATSDYAAGQWLEGLDETLDMSTFEGSIANLIDTFTIEDNPVNIKLLNKNGSELGMYGSDDLPFNVKSQMMDTFNTDDNYLEVNVTENGDGTTVNDLFNYYRPDDDNQTTFVVTNVDTDEEEDFEDLTKFLEKYGDYYIDGALGLRTLNIYIADGDLETEVEPLDDEEIEELGKENAEKEEAEVTEESLIEEIINSYPGLKLNRINNALSEEYFIADSIRLNEDIDLVYKNFVKPTNNEKLIEHFKSYTGYEDEVDKFLREHNISKEKYNDIINENTTISKEIENNETNEKENQLTEKLLTSVKTRAELGEAINKLVEAKEKYRIAKSLTEGYRYDIFVNENCKLNEDPFDDEIEVVDNDSNAEEVNTELVDNTPSTEVVEPVTTTDIVPEDMNPEDVEVVHKIDRIANDICNAIQETYGVDISDHKNMVVADIIQDLQLIGGNKVADDLENTPIGDLTKQMYKEFNGFYDALDELVSFFTGQKITTSQADRLASAIKSLDSDSFATDTIYTKIASPKFLQAAQAGYIPYIDPAALQAPVDECVKTFDEDYNTEDRLAELKKIQKERKLTDDEAEELAYCENEVDSRKAEQRYLNGECESFDIDDFDECINEYLYSQDSEIDEAYNTINVKTENNTVIIEGLITREDKTEAITFTATPVLNESNNAQTKYIVTNNKNDLEFDLEL